MGLVIIGMMAYIIIVLLFCVILVLNVLINSRKVGFKKAIRSKTAISMLVLVFFCGVVPSILFVLGSNPRSGEQLVKDFVLNPVPMSVEVLDSYDASPNFDPIYCLHFKIAPGDFQKILESKQWEPVTHTKYNGFQCDYRNSAWDFSFPPPALGENVKTYIFNPNERSSEYLFTNSQMNEVYYYYYDGYIP
jgi:hypothetical protein